MITGTIKSQIDQIWNAFWAGGIANPLEVIEQITYLLFIRRLDDLHTLEENKANRLRLPMERRVFPEGRDAKGRPYEDLRWSRFRHFGPADMHTVVGEHLFPYLRDGLARQLGNGDSTYAHHMQKDRAAVPGAVPAPAQTRRQQAIRFQLMLDGEKLAVQVDAPAPRLLAFGPGFPQGRVLRQHPLEHFLNVPLELGAILQRLAGGCGSQAGTEGVLVNGGLCAAGVLAHTDESFDFLVECRRPIRLQALHAQPEVVALDVQVELNARQSGEVHPPLEKAV